MNLPDDPSIWLGLLYLSVYVTVGALGVRQELREPSWPRALFFGTLPAFPLAAFGAFAWLAGLDPGHWGLDWRIVFFYAVLADAIEMPFALKRVRESEEPGQDGELSESENRVLSIAAALLAFAVFELPCLWMNWTLAFAA